MVIEENFLFKHKEEEIPVRVRSNSPGDMSVSILLDGVVRDFRISRNFQSEGDGLFSGPGNHWRILRKGNQIFIHYKGWNTKVFLSNREVHLEEEGNDGLIKSPMPGKVIRILVSPGASVQKGTILAIVEAMKMENNILSPGEGIVEEVFVGEGSMVAQDDVILKLNLSKGTS
ncbi:biotin-requiring enzyme [Leptospira borgpetersenii serovar Javanica str. UI 09931]|uniref:Biotin-requiring enzyme n=1 Tax=Leptospira borgpetersenii serovar Javanica str. UI 09931 TaxID=1049767 RepID=A0AAV3J982_LEPBO|nr:acetyl-CoA carboxylase biotin carboxyl carrier protein subunit [Leptospira borgpetersenii]EMO11139.1 biotin-requiring enzyme [Leptospira borgpetersenii str. Noumea 25]ENO65739.1 biotin-requiring enzyme [Leptospira borgpetersenii serovar Mini str. 201000851]EPG56535.1 biotin-requiring enzyme [Leptospira borgpetersenii serovar Javanica str. UI 09931]